MPKLILGEVSWSHMIWGFGFKGTRHLSVSEVVNVGRRARVCWTLLWFTVNHSQHVKRSIFITVPFFKLAMRHWSEPLIVAQFRKTDLIFDGAMEQISIIKCHNFDMGNYQCSNYRCDNNSSFHFAANDELLSHYALRPNN